MSAHEKQALRRICLFTVTVYVKAWFNATNSCDAPYNDLCLLQTVESYRAVDSEIADIVLCKLRRHLWYLSEDLAGLALFSDHVCAAEKRAMIASLKKPQQKSDLQRVDPQAVDCFQSKALSDFVTERSHNLFAAVRIDTDFLKDDPDTWHDNSAYCNAKGIVSGLRVVNDCAERAVKLATDYNMSLMHDDTERQLWNTIASW